MSKIYAILIAAIIFLIGFALLFYFNKKDHDCAICHSKKSIIALNTPEAKEIIRDNNLSIPEEFPEEKKYPWQA